MNQLPHVRPWRDERGNPAGTKNSLFTFSQKNAIIPISHRELRDGLPHPLRRSIGGKNGKPVRSLFKSVFLFLTSFRTSPVFLLGYPPYSSFGGFNSLPNLFVSYACALLRHAPPLNLFRMTRLRKSLLFSSAPHIPFTRLIPKDLAQFR